MSREFIITAISSSNVEYDKSVPQIPVILSIPGVISLRDRAEVYKVFTSKAEGE
jgi:hypothetical protein